MSRSRAAVALATIATTMLLVAGPARAQEPSITVEPNANLSDGDTVTVTVAGFPASSTAFVSGQCVTPIQDPLAQCDTGNIVPVPLDANGAATFEITVKTGTVGSGTCGADGDDCVILVGSLSEPQNAAAPITFMPDLPATGPEHVLPFSVIAALLLAAGAAFVMLARRPDRRYA